MRFLIVVLTSLVFFTFDTPCLAAIAAAQSVCDPPDVSALPLNCSGGSGTLPTSITSQYAASGCNSAASITISTAALTPAGTSASAPVPIFIACGTVSGGSSVEVAGGATAASLAAVRPVSVMIQYMVLTEAMFVLSGFLQEGSAIVLRGNSVKRTTGHISRSPIDRYGMLLLMFTLELLRNTTVNVVENAFVSSFGPLASFIISQAGDTIMREYSTFRFAENNVLLERSGDQYGSHALLSTTFNSVPARFVLTDSFALAEIMSNNFTATCQVAFLSLHTTLQNGTIRVSNNTFHKSDTTTTYPAYALSCISIMAIFSNARQGYLEVYDNTLRLYAVPTSGDTMVFIENTSPVGGYIFIDGNAYASSLVTTSTPIVLRLGASTGLRLYITNNVFNKTFATATGFISFAGAPLSATDVYVRIAGNTLLSPTQPPPYQPVLTFAGAQTFAANIFQICYNEWYGAPLTRANVSSAFSTTANIAAVADLCERSSDGANCNVNTFVPLPPNCRFSVLPLSISGDYTSLGCDVVAAAGTVVDLSLMATATGDSAAQIYLSCGTVMSGSALTIKGLPAASAGEGGAVTVPPANITITGYLFTESILVLRGVFPAGTTVTVTQTTIRKSTGAPDDHLPQSIKGTSSLMYWDSLVLLASVSVTISRCSLLSSANKLYYPVFVMYNGDVVVGYGSAIRFQHNTMRLDNASAFNNAHGFYRVTGTGATNFILRAPTALFEINHNNLSSSCQVQMLPLNLDLTNGSVVVRGNNFTFDSSTHSVDSLHVAITVIAVMRSVGGRIDLSHNRIVFTEPYRNAFFVGGFISADVNVDAQFSPSSSAIGERGGGQLTMSHNTVTEVGPANGRTSALELRIGGGGENLRIVVEGNTLKRTLVTTTPFISFSNSTVGANTTLLLVRNAVTCADKSTTAVLLGGVALSAPYPSSVFACGNTWYGLEVNMHSVLRHPMLDPQVTAPPNGLNFCALNRTATATVSGRVTVSSSIGAGLSQTNTPERPHTVSHTQVDTVSASIPHAPTPSAAVARTPSSLFDPSRTVSIVPIPPSAATTTTSDATNLTVTSDASNATNPSSTTAESASDATDANTSVASSTPLSTDASTIANETSVTALPPTDATNSSTSGLTTTSTSPTGATSVISTTASSTTTTASSTTPGPTCADAENGPALSTLPWLIGPPSVPDAAIRAGAALTFHLAFGGDGALPPLFTTAMGDVFCMTQHVSLVSIGGNSKGFAQERPANVTLTANAQLGTHNVSDVNVTFVLALSALPAYTTVEAEALEVLVPAQLVLPCSAPSGGGEQRGPFISIGRLFVTPTAIDPILADANDAATVVSDAVTIIAAVGGFGAAAAEQQALSALAMMSCADPNTRQAFGSYRALSPFALWDSYIGVVAGNFVFLAAVFCLQFVVLLALRVLQRVRRWEELSALIHFPAIVLNCSFAVHTGTAYAASQLITLPERPAEDRAVGALAFVFTILYPLWLVGFAYWFIGRAYQSYAMGECALERGWPAWVTRVLPHGAIYAPETRRTFGAYISSYRLPHHVWPSYPTWTALIFAIGGLFHPSTVPECQALFAVMGVAFVACCCVVLYFRPRRADPSNWLDGAAQLISAITLFLMMVAITAGDGGANAATAILYFGFVQTAVTILRMLYLLSLFYFDRLLEPLPTTQEWVHYTNDGAKTAKRFGTAEEYADELLGEASKRELDEVPEVALLPPPAKEQDKTAPAAASNSLSDSDSDDDLLGTPVDPAPAKTDSDTAHSSDIDLSSSASVASDDDDFL